MTVNEIVPIIKKNFMDLGGQTLIPLQKRGHFRAKLVEEGIKVDNLGNQTFLPWCVFQEAVCVLIRNGGTAKRGDTMSYRLGDEGLRLDSVEGHIALVVYGKEISDSVFRRITPIACILEWAGICRSEPGKIILAD